MRTPHPSASKGAIMRRWLLLLLASCMLSLGACKEEGQVILNLAAAPDQGLDKVSSLLFHFEGDGLKETPKPFKVSVSDGSAKIPSLPIDEKTSNPFFDARVYGLDDSGKVVAFGGMRLPLISKSFEYNLFFSGVERFARLTDLRDTSTNKLMPQNFVGHQVVALKDGRILIAGGANQTNESKGFIGVPSNRNMLRNLIIYDPTTGIFDTGPTLGNSRVFHTATLLPDGRVLLAGGLTYISRNGAWQLEALRTLEIYDPRDESLTLATGPMAVSRAFHTATLLSDGGVLFVGGLAAPLHDKKGPDRVGQQVTKIEVYRSDTNTGGQVVGNLSKTDGGRFLHKAVAVAEDKVLVVGGLGIDSAGDRIVQPTALMIRRSGGNWTPSTLKDSNIKPRYDHTLLQAKIGEDIWAVAIGGRGDGNRPVPEFEVWDSNGKIVSSGKLNIPRYGHASAFMANQKILVVGGHDASHKAVLEGEVYEVQESGGGLTLQIQNTKPRLQAQDGRYKPVALTAPFDPRVYLFGGGVYKGEGPGGKEDSLFQGVNTVELYTPSLSLPSTGE